MGTYVLTPWYTLSISSLEKQPVVFSQYFYTGCFYVIINLWKRNLQLLG